MSLVVSVGYRERNAAQMLVAATKSIFRGQHIATVLAKRAAATNTRRERSFRRVSGKRVLMRKVKAMRITLQILMIWMMSGIRRH